jgi:hypothetical protein
VSATAALLGAAFALVAQRTRLEQVRERARRQGGPEGERLEAQATARQREIEQRIADLRASLE